jgi:hypothetical protein
MVRKFRIQPNHSYCFSDGSAAKYKNGTNIISLCSYEKDFGVTAEWLFYAESCGKGPFDGLAGTSKWLI